MPSQYPYIQFTATPDVGATVRYDFNDGIGEVPAIDLGTPTLLGDPNGVNVQYGPRTIRIQQEIVADRATVLARLDTLAKEVLRRRNWLLVQMDASTAPVWYHTFRSVPESLQLEKVSDGTQDFYTITVDLLAEPAAYGAPVTTGELSYNLNQTAASKQLRLMLPALKGDLPVPIRVEHYGKNVSTYLSVTDDWIACSPCSSSTSPVYGKAVHSGLGGGTVTWTPALTNVRPGRYRVVIISPTSFTGFAFGWSPDGGSTTFWSSKSPSGAYYTTSRSLAPGVSNKWYDMGELTFRSADGATIAAPTIVYSASGASTGTTVGVLLIPVVEFGVDEPASIIEHAKLPAVAASTLPVRFIIDDSEDHDHQALACSTVGTQGYLFSAAVAGASQLIAHPQFANCLTLLGQVGGTTSAYVVVTYRPRYLNLRGD